jgi:hypothetical protein
MCEELVKEEVMDSDKSNSIKYGAWLDDSDKVQIITRQILYTL